MKIEGVTRRGHKSLPVLEKLSFTVPARSSLPTLDKYSHLEHNGDSQNSWVRRSESRLSALVHTLPDSASLRRAVFHLA